MTTEEIDAAATLKAYGAYLQDSWLLLKDFREAIRIFEREKWRLESEEREKLVRPMAYPPLLGFLDD